MKHAPSTIRAWLRPAFSAAAMWTLALAGVAGATAPAFLAGSAWPPLHARCMAVTALSLSVALAQARRTLDPVALHVPLLALACWLLSMVGLTWVEGGALSLWHEVLAGLGAIALAVAPIEGDFPAPAQRADRGWRLMAGVALLVAVPLLIVPRGVASHWPWRLGAPLVAQYAGMFLAWGVAAWLASRERRRYVRAPVAWGLLAWAVGVLLTSLWHLAAFRLQSRSAWLWFSALAATAAVAAHLVRPVGAWRLCQRSGP